MHIRELFTSILAKTEAGEDTVLVTVVAEAGSSPRSAGAHLLADKNGRICGTIGGGAVEYRSIEYARRLLGQRQSRRKTYRLRPNDEEDLGMICGGDMEVFFQYIEGGDAKTAALMREALARLDRAEDLWLFIELGSPDGWSMALYGAGLPLAGMELAADTLAALTRNRGVLVQAGERRVYGEPINCSGTVYIFGGGHCAQALEPLLSGVGFRCVVFDNREEFVSRGLFPGAYALICGDYERIGETLTLSSSDYIVIMTHAWDLVVLRQLVSTQCAYIGVIGSKTKVARVKQQLVQERFSEETIRRIKAPIGLPIRSETPEEIAISIAAEMILCRAEQRVAVPRPAPKKPPVAL